tara:strand:- start:475 stop:1212 length:738 start_codon:yes stop_codon:yes gene_type:complete
MIYLHKILPFIISPLGLTLILLILSIFIYRRILVLVSLFILLISSNTFISNYLLLNLENPYKPIEIKTTKNTDAIIVLSGMIHQVGDNKINKYEWRDPDRFFAGIELLNNNKANFIVFTGGSLPWTKNWKPEGVILKEKAIELGINPNNILVTNNVQNTFQESVEVLKLLKYGSSITLVTSAFHMERSKYLFEKQGFKVIPYPVDFKVSNSNNTILDYMPNLSALKNTSLFIRENIGRFYYKIIM